MRPATDQGPCTTFAEDAQRCIGQPNLSSGNDKMPSVLDKNQMATNLSSVVPRRVSNTS
jgi:hypothetical protein